LTKGKKKKIRNMAKRKHTRNEISVEVDRFLENVHTIGGSHQNGLELIIAQYVHVLAESPRKVQVEHLMGLRNLVREMKVDRTA
jgi:hypothetical protein